ncbi:MAG: response regulator [Bacteroidales bacterium]|nr:response regulator [Bacteroidales bacterium]
MKNILIVEDNEGTRILLEDALRDNGYEISIANDGQDALKILEDKSSLITLIITDLQMPVMDGIEFIKKVRENDTTIPILVLTTNALQKQQAKESGASGYIVKPFSMKHLVSAIEALTKDE